MLCAAGCIYGRGCLSLSVDARCVRASRASVYFLFPEHLQTTARVCIMFPLLVLSEMCERMCYILGCASDCASAGLIPEGGLHACVCVCVCVYVQWGKALLQVMCCYIRLYLVSDSAPLLQPFCNSILSIVVSSFIFLIFSQFFFVKMMACYWNTSKTIGWMAIHVSPWMNPADCDDSSGAIFRFVNDKIPKYRQNIYQSH